MFSHWNHATKAYISAGSNLGDRAGNLLLAVRGMLEAGLCVCRVSSIYETEPVSEVAQPPVLNLVAEIGNPLPAPEQVMAKLLRIEFLLGRTRAIEDGPRTVDLDLLLYGEFTSDTEFLRLPHPRLHQRRFVLEPLVEVAPHVIHPVLKISAEHMLLTLQDDSAVKRWTP